MTPDVDQILKTSAAQLMTNIMPLLPPGYAQGHASLLSFMMIMSAQEYGRAAEVRAAENADMRSLFAALASDIADRDLREKLVAAAEVRDPSLAIAALNASNAELRRLLIALHVHVETHGPKAAERRIWEVLQRAAARRVVTLG